MNHHHPKPRTTLNDTQPALPSQLQKPDKDPQNANFSSLLVLLSQKVAAFADENHVFGKIQFSACGGLRWVCQNLVTLDRGFRRMSRV
jgi:hypothetical protein